MTKSVAYVQKYFAQILFAAVLGYVGWMGIEINTLGKDVATLKANNELVDFRLNAVEKRLDNVEAQLISITEILARIDQRLTRIEQHLFLSQGGASIKQSVKKGSEKSGGAEKP